MMFDATNPVKLVDGAVHVIDDTGKTLAIFTEHDLASWRKFQAKVAREFSLVITDKFMPKDISATIPMSTTTQPEHVPTGG